MTARDRYTIKLKCPKCHAVGAAYASENDGWAAKNDVGFRIDDVSEGFEVYNLGRTSVETNFRCTDCKVLVDD